MKHDAGTEQCAKGHTCALRCTEGFFRYCDRGLPAHVWFQHDIIAKTSTYIIQGCPDCVKETIQEWAKTTAAANLFRPLALETLIIDEVTWEWSKAVVEASKRLLEYVRILSNQVWEIIVLTGYQELFSSHENADRIDTAVHSLHNLSQHLHILQEEMNGMVEQLDYLLHVHETLEAASFTTLPERGLSELITSDSTFGVTSTADSLRFLRSRTHNWSRWLGNWKERTEVRIHLFFNLAAQRDNNTNARIAQLTTQIANETHKDSSSMMT